VNVAVLSATVKDKGEAMSDKISAGTLLIREGARLPEFLRFESEPFSNGWRLVKNFDSYALDRKSCEAGWAFVHMAGETIATAVGFDKPEAARHAVKRGLATLKSNRSNCLEITQVILKRFKGLLYVAVSARRRHI